MKNKSIWLDDDFEKLKSVNTDLKTDVLIIGGGITGISILYQLNKNNIKALLVEKNICGKGVTSKSTAKITYLQEKIYMNIRKLESDKIAKKYLHSQTDAVKILADIIKNENIKCDLERVDSILFSNCKNNYKKIEDEYNFLINSNIKAKIENFSELNNAFGLRVTDTFVFNPFKYINGLKKILKDYIYENSKVEKIEKKDNFYLCNVNNHVIKAKYVVIATHYPYFIYPFLLPAKSHIETSYLGTVKVNKTLPISAINIDEKCISLRYCTKMKNKYLIYLYGSYKGSNIKNIKDNFDELTKKNSFNYIWSNKDIITSDYRPYIGRIYKNDDTFLISCGYNTWGMTNATIGSVILKDIILKRKNKYIELFDPNRSLNLNNIVNFPLNLFNSAKSYIISGKSNINNKNIKYKKINGIDIAVYTDENGKEHKVINKCPHMKCGLIFNDIEKNWDCICHGSRFDTDGNSIEGPSNYNIKYKE